MKWSIKAAPGQEGLLYLIGERNTSFGINKFIITCGGDRLLRLHIIFDPQGRQDLVMQMGAQSLSIDNQTIPFRKFLIGETKILNGWLNASYLLPESITDKIGLSKTVGFTFQLTYKAPIFFGFQGMSFEGGRQFFHGLRASCSG